MSYSRRYQYISIALIAIFILAFGAILFPSVSAQAEPTTYYLDLSQTVVSTANEITEGDYRIIEEGDTFTFTYAIDANGGMDYSVWVPKYDISAFTLTSVVIGSSWVSMDEVSEDYKYVYIGMDEEEEYLSLAEHIARYESEYLAHAADASSPMTYSYLAFDVTSEMDGVYPTSEAFLTLTYRARATYTEAVRYEFGFSFGEVPLAGGIKGRLTNASRYSHYDAVHGGSAQGVVIRMSDGAGDYLPMAEEANFAATSYAVTVTPTIDAYLEEYQTLYFKGGVIDTGDIEYTITYPAGEGAENPYIADHGVITCVFYDGDPADGGEPLGALPTQKGTYYVCGIFSDSDIYYKGMTTEAVQIEVEKENIAIDLNAVVGEADPVYAVDALLSVHTPYGPTVTVRDGTTVLDEHKYDCVFFTRADDTSEWEASADSAFLYHRLHAGEYKVLISPKDPDRQTFGLEEDIYTVIIEVTRVDIVVTANDIHITYGEVVPDLTCTVEGVVEGDLESSITADAQVVLSLPANFEGHADTYAISVAGKAAITNYNLFYVPGQLVIAPKSVTLTVSYEDGYAIFSLQGFLSTDEPVILYSVGPTLASATEADSSYSAQDAYAWGSLISVFASAGDDYAITPVELATPCRVQYVSSVGGAENVPTSDAFLFAGERVSRPLLDPTISRYEFRGWKSGSAYYDFSSLLFGDLIIMADFEKTEYEYIFRAAEGEHFDSMRALSWVGGKFVLAEEPAGVYVFRKETAIPTLSDIAYFKIDKWVKAVSDGQGGYTYLTDEAVTTFSVADSSEVSDVYFIACMTLDIGVGDLNGDRVVNVEDILRYKKWLVGANYDDVKVETAADAWTKVTTAVPAGGYFFPMALDVDEDGICGLVDVLCIAESLVGGYPYVKVSDCTVLDGEEGDYAAGERVISRDLTVEVSDGEKLTRFAYVGTGLLLTEDLEAEDFFFDGIRFVLDLGGNAIEMGKLTISAKVEVVIKNGTVSCTGYSISSAGGVLIENVIGLPDVDGSATSVSAQ